MEKSARPTLYLKCAFLSQNGSHCSITIGTGRLQNNTCWEAWHNQTHPSFLVGIIWKLGLFPNSFTFNTKLPVSRSLIYVFPEDVFGFFYCTCFLCRKLKLLKKTETWNSGRLLTIGLIEKILHIFPQGQRLGYLRRTWKHKWIQNTS